MNSINSTSDFSRNASPKIALTFDDGPHAVHTPRLLELAAKKRIRLTFFVIGECVKRNRDILMRIRDGGHEIGNHSWSHRNLANLSREEIRQDLLRTDEMIEGIIGSKPRLMRPPFGELESEQRQWIADELQYEICFWNVDSEDWRCKSADAVVERILAEVHPGSIVLSHDTISSTVDAMPMVIDALFERQYEMLTVSDLRSFINMKGVVDRMEITEL